MSFRKSTASSRTRNSSLPARERPSSRSTSRPGSGPRLPSLSTAPRSPLSALSSSRVQLAASTPATARDRQISYRSSRAKGRNSSAPRILVSEDPAPVASSATPVELCSYDVVLKGKVFTGIVDGTCPFAECVAFSRASGRICFVGSCEDLQDRTDAKELHRAIWCRKYNASGLILPAFHDAHCHPFGAGNRLRQWDNPHAEEEDAEYRAAALDVSDCKSWDEVKAALQMAVRRRSEDDKVDGVLFAEKCKAELFNREGGSVAKELGEILSEQPLVLLIGSPQAEAVAVNHAAIQALRAKFSSWHFPDSDKRIGRTRTGQLTGYFHGTVWITRFALLSPASVASQGVRGLRDGLLELPKSGIVACTDAFVFEDRMPCYEVAFAEDAKRQLPRVNLSLGFKPSMSAESISEIAERAPQLRHLWEDTNYRYCLREGKVEVDNGCDLNWEKDQLASLVHSMISASFSMHMHVFYSEAAEHSLNLLLDAESRAPSVKSRKSAPLLTQQLGDRRHKLAHAFALRPEDTQTLGKNPCVHVVYQPVWFRSEYSYDEDAVGTHRELLQNGASVCYGSDWDITDLSPLLGLRAVLSRTGIYVKERPWPERLADALRLLTREAARSMWLEDCSGTLEVGKFADICILDKDIFEMPEDEFCFVDDEATRYRLGKEEPPVKVMATFSRAFCIFQRPLDEEGVTLERSRSAPPPQGPIDPEKETDYEFLCGTCTCGLREGQFVAQCC